MEETTQEQVQIPDQPQAPMAGPSAVSRKKGKKILAIILLLAAVILIAGALFYFLGQKKQAETQSSPTPNSGLYVTSETPIPVPNQTSEPVADKKAVSISILNGTGIAGEASYLQGKLRALGYEDVTPANASNQNNTITTLQYLDTLPRSILDEITGELQKTYQDVTTSKSSSLDVDLQITTGLRKGATAKPSLVPTASPSPSPVASPSVTPSSSPTSTP
jgi:uncharacterized protein HemX